jgi:hypothetical protein
MYKIVSLGQDYLHKEKVQKKNIGMDLCVSIICKIFVCVHILVHNKYIHDAIALKWLPIFCTSILSLWNGFPYFVHLSCNFEMASHILYIYS